MLTIFLLKMESNTAKLKAEAETKILQAMEEEQSLHDEVKEKKRQYLFAEKKRLVNELLDLQVWNNKWCFPFLTCVLINTVVFCCGTAYNTCKQMKHG